MEPRSKEKDNITRDLSGACTCVSTGHTCRHVRVYACTCFSVRVTERLLKIDEACRTGFHTFTHTRLDILSFPPPSTARTPGSRASRI